jgi:hypothetical protein
MSPLCTLTLPLCREHRRFAGASRVRAAHELDALLERPIHTISDNE